MLIPEAFHGTGAVFQPRSWHSGCTRNLLETSEVQLGAEILRQ